MLRDDEADRRMANTPSLLAYLPRILMYPLSGYGLGALLMLTIALWFGTQSIFGIALFAIAAPWVFHYAEGVIDQTSQGRATPPAFGGDMIYLGSNATALRPLIGVALISTAWLLVRDRGPWAEAAVLVFGAFLFPAFMLVLTVENSVLAALNPLQLIPAIVGVGPAYLFICVVLAAAAVVTTFAASQAARFGAIFFGIYFWLLMFHLLGYVAYHRADKLGLRVRSGAPTDDSRRMEEQQARLVAVIAKIDEALLRKDLAAAAKALLAEPGGPADFRLFHEELFEQLQVATRCRPELVHLQGQRLIGFLLRDRRAARALDIAETCFDQHLDFSTARPAEAVALAEAALQNRRDGLFERLTHDAARRYVADPAAVVSLAFLTAKFSCDRKRDDARAREILKPLLAQTGHPQHRQIAAYAKAIGAA
jgi:hypothetical protein